MFRVCSYGCSAADASRRVVVIDDGLERCASCGVVLDTDGGRTALFRDRHAVDCIAELFRLSEWRIGGSGAEFIEAVAGVVRRVRDIDSVNVCIDCGHRFAGVDCPACFGWTCVHCGKPIEPCESGGWQDLDSSGLVFCSDQDETHDRVRHEA
jgi:hypothetical protein